MGAVTASTYTPSKPGDSAVLERLARQAQEGVSMDDARELVLRAYMAGFAAGVGEYVSDPAPVEHYDATVEGPEQHGPASVHTDGYGVTVQIDCYCDRVFAGTAPVGDFEAHLATAGLDERLRSDAALVVGELDAKAREAAEL